MLTVVLQEHDGADDLLNAERAHLLNCKKALEAQLRSVQQQLQVSTHSTPNEKMLKKEDNSGKLLNVLPLAIIICNENVLKSFFLAHEEGKKYFSEPKTCHFYRHILIPTNSSFQCRLIMFLQYHT